jgi:hypothetical protein
MTPAHRQGAYKSAAHLVVGNIQNVVDQAQRILSAHTGDTCCVCIKNIEQQDDGRLVIKPLVRDRLASKDNRGRFDDKLYGPDENTAFRTILSGRANFYVSDNLIAEAERTDDRRYINPRPFWRDDYNATFVQTIRKSSEPRSKGFLCVDNKIGHLNNEDVNNYMKEFCYRIAIMLYRSEVLARGLAPQNGTKP